MGIDSHLSTCVGTQSPKYLEMAQGHISLSAAPAATMSGGGSSPTAVPGAEDLPKTATEPVAEDPAAAAGSLQVA
jgi:hypothetical protein